MGAVLRVQVHSSPAGVILPDRRKRTAKYIGILAAWHVYDVEHGGRHELQQGVRAIPLESGQLWVCSHGLKQPSHSKNVKTTSADEAAYVLCLPWLLSCYLCEDHTFATDVSAVLHSYSEGRATAVPVFVSSVS